MSSTERAPEPTMEEILASIRRIISDDEASSVQQRATSAEYAEQVRADDTEDGAADTQMIAEIERALAGGTSPASNDDDIEDILDLTEPGGSAADEVMMADEPVTVLEEFVLETESYDEEPRKLDFASAFPPANEDRQDSPLTFAETAPTFVEEAAPSYEEEAVATYEPEPAPFVEMPVPAPEPVRAAEPIPSLDDPTTALERAIAALKAGDLAAFAREAQSDYVAPEPSYTPPLYTPPEPVAEAAPAETSFEPEPASYEPEPTMIVEEEEIVVLPEPEPEPEPVVPSWAAESASWSQMEPSEPEPEPEPEAEPEPEPEFEPEPLPWRSEDQSWRGAAPANEFELNPTRVNGGSEHEPHDFASPVSSKSLEDSVKEMLRPLLRQWLDENMPRVLTAALREELENSDVQRR